MILPRAHTWMHLLPRDVAYACESAPHWFREPLDERGGAGASCATNPALGPVGASTGAGSGAGSVHALVAWQQKCSDLPDLAAYDALVAVNSRTLSACESLVAWASRPCVFDRRNMGETPMPLKSSYALSERALREAGFTTVRRFAAVPNLREARWFIPLDAPAITSAGFCLFTPFKRSARLKLLAARAAIHARAPVWYRDEVCIALRSASPLEAALGQLFPDRSIRLAFSTGALGPDARRKPSLAILGPAGEQLAFAKLAGSSVAHDLLRHETKVLTALAAVPALNGRVPRLLFAGAIEGTYTLVQSPLLGRTVGPELTPAHHSFLNVLRVGPRKPVAATAMIVQMRADAATLPSTATDFSGVLDDAMAALADLHLPATINHTDFVPWNLRLRGDGVIGAFDWDTAELDGVPLYDELRHLTFVGFCIHHWTAEHAHARVKAFAASAPLGLRPAEVEALAVVYLTHALLKFIRQGHDETHATVRWHQELLARLRTTVIRPQPATSGRSAASPFAPLDQKEFAHG